MLRNILDTTPCEECVVFNHKEEIAHLIDYDIMRDYPHISFKIEDNMFDLVQDTVVVHGLGVPSNAVHINHPFYFLYHTMSYGLDSNCNIGEEDTMYCFLNNRVRPFRKLLWDRMSEDNMLNEYSAYSELGVDSPDMVMSRTEWIKQNHAISNFPPLFYHKVAADVFVETEVNRIRYTEKTWKPLFHGKICLGFGGKHFYRTLKSLGFKLHEDYIDYSFDEISDLNERFEAYYTQVKRLPEFNIDELVKRTAAEREENRKNCFRLILDAEVPDEQRYDGIPTAQDHEMFYSLCKTQAWEMTHLGKILSEEERINTREETWYGES
jgi:hypothetical protein